MPFFQPHWWWNDRVIAPTLATARFQRWLNGVPTRRIDVIPYFTDPARLSPTKSRSAVREELGVVPDAFLIMCVGKVSRRKNQVLLVQALQQLRQRGQRAVVALVGGIDERSRRSLDEALRDTELVEQVKLLGLRRDIPDLLAASDCFCLPSNREVMPIACREAMAAGVPIVVTDIPGVRESLQDGVHALIVRRNDAAALAGALERVAADAELRRRIVDAARQKIVSEYSPGVVVPRIVECYRAARRQRLGAEAVE